MAKVYVNGVDRTEDARYRLYNGWGEAQPFRIESMDYQILEFVDGWIPFGPYNRYYYEYQKVIEMQDCQDGSTMDGYIPFMSMLRDKLGEDLVPMNKLSTLSTRAEWVKLIEGITLDLLDKLDDRGFTLAENTRGGRDYGRAGLDIIEAIWTGKRAMLSPDVRNRGTLPGFNPEYVTTTTSIVDATGVHPMVTEPLPPHIMSFILSAKQYELCAVEAAMTGNYKMALEALVASPVINDFFNAKKCLDELLVSQKEYLPLVQFF